jgi:hypothetical protein
MWEYELSVWTAARPDAVWRRWSDMATWPEWNDGVETITGDAPDGLGPAITADFPDVLARLAAIA